MEKVCNALYVMSCLGSLPLIAQERPNIIVFLVDDMGLMDTSVPFITDRQGFPQQCPLNGWYHTPGMERLAQQGVRFSNFYAQSVSSPSRTSLMTGQNAARHRTTNWINAESNNRSAFGPFDWNWDGLKKTTPHYPKLLQSAGYRTIHVGKAHFGRIGGECEDPKNVGFDVNIAGSAIGHPGSYYGEWGYGWIKGNKARAVPGLEKYHHTDTFLSEALTIEAISQIDKAVAEGVPFYLNMSHYAVHGPFQKDKRFIEHYDEGTKGAKAAAFATLIEGMDKSLGDILEHLEQMGIAESTIIIFLGDNGSDAPLGDAGDHGSSAPLRGKKGSEYEGGMRVPFIMAWAKPNDSNRLQQKYPVARNIVQNQIGTIMDIYPTVLSLAGVTPPKGYELDGADLKKLASGKSDPHHRDDFLMHFPHEHRGSYFTVYRKGDWKLIYYYHPEDPAHPTMKLYNLSVDPFENKDVSRENQKKLKYMFNKMSQRLAKENACYPIDKEKRSLHPFWPFK